MILMDFMPKEMRPPGKVFRVLNLNLGHDSSLIKKPSSALQEKSNNIEGFKMFQSLERLRVDHVLRRFGDRFV